jgi:hypothetical protein
MQVEWASAWIMIPPHSLLRLSGYVEIDGKGSIPVATRLLEHGGFRPKQREQNAPVNTAITETGCATKSKPALISQTGAANR